MPKIVLCKCYYGGYDFCAECGGSGVIILHGKNDYRPLNIITNKLPEEILSSKLTLRERVLHHVKIDESLITFLKRKFFLFPKEKRLKIIEILIERLNKWNASIADISDKSLKDDVIEYTKELNGRIRFLYVNAIKNRQKVKIKKRRPKRKR